MHTWHLPRILGQSTCSFQYPACREHDWKVTWSFERRRRIAWFLMIGLRASITTRGSFKPACKQVQRTCTLSCWLSASQNLLALEAPSNLVSEWKTEPFSGTWRNYGVLMYSVPLFIVEYLGSYMNVYRCYWEPPCEHMNPSPSSTKQLTVACWRKAKWLRIWCLRPVLIRTTSKVKADPW